MSRRALVFAGLVVSLTTSSACTRGLNPRTQHVVDDQVVFSPPPSSGEYAAYIRVRVALDTEGADLERAQHDLTVLLARNPRDAHLWTTSAELESRLGNHEKAERALARALELSPDYGPALALRSEWDTPNAATAARQPESGSQPPPAE